MTPTTLPNSTLKPLTPCKDCERIEPTPVAEPLRAYLLMRRRTLIAELASLEDLLGVARSIPTARERRNLERTSA